MRRPLALCLFALLGAAMPAWADAPPSSKPTDALTDQARELHVKGAALFEKGQYAQAEAAFRAAWALKSHFTIAANLGACELKLGKARDAAEHLAYAVRLYTPESSPEREVARKLLAEARAKVATLTVLVDADRAEVLVDGASVGATPLSDPLFLEPGAHTIEVRNEGEIRGSAKLDAKAGGDETIRLSAKKRPVEVQERRTVPAVISFSVGGAGLVAGAIGAGLAVGKADELRAACGAAKQCPSSARGLASDAEAFANVANVGFVVAGVGAAVGAVLLLLPPAKKTGAQAGVLVGPGFVGVRGSF